MWGGERERETEVTSTDAQGASRALSRRDRSWAWCSGVGTAQLLPSPSRLCRIPCCHTALLPWGSRHKELQPNLWLGDKGPLPALSQGGPRTPHHLSARPAGLQLRDRGPGRTVQASPHRLRVPSVRSTRPHGPGAGVGGRGHERWLSSRGGSTEGPGQCCAPVQTRANRCCRSRGSAGNVEREGGLPKHSANSHNDRPWELRGEQSYWLKHQ